MRTPHATLSDFCSFLGTFGTAGATEGQVAIRNKIRNKILQESGAAEALTLMPASGAGNGVPAPAASLLLAKKNGDDDADDFYDDDVYDFSDEDDANASWGR